MYNSVRACTMTTTRLQSSYLILYLLFPTDFQRLFCRFMKLILLKIKRYKWLFLYNQRKFKLVKRSGVYYQSVIPPSLFFECSLRNPTDSMMYQGGPKNEKTHTSYFYGICNEREGLR